MTKTSSKVNYAELFSKPYGGFAKINESAEIVTNRDPRPGVYNPAEDLLVKEGHKYARDILGVALPAVEKLTPDQRSKVIGYAQDQAGLYESEAFAVAQEKGALSAMLSEAAENPRKLASLEGLLVNDEFAQRTGQSGDKWRAQYMDYLSTVAAQKAVSEKGIGALADEDRAVYFSEGALAYGDEIAKRLADAKKYTKGSISFARSEAAKEFLRGGVPKVRYAEIMSHVARRKKAKLVGLNPDADEEKIAKKFDEVRQERLVDYAAKGIGAMLKGSTSEFRNGMAQLRALI